MQELVLLLRLVGHFYKLSYKRLKIQYQASEQTKLKLSFLPEIQFKLISGRTPFGRRRNCDWTAFSVNVMGTCCNWQVKINLQLPHFLIWKF